MRSTAPRLRPVNWKAMNKAAASALAVEEHKERAMTLYQAALETLNKDRVPYLLGGAYAFMYYTGIERHTKDLDLFVDQADMKQVLGSLQKAGFRTELTFSHWLAKALSEEDVVIDIIFGSGNGICKVDPDWFGHSLKHTFLGVPVSIIPAEEMLWSKAFILERNRYDGADIAHLLRARSEKLDWKRLLDRFGNDWPVLLSHLIFFRYIYPSERLKIPASVMEELLQRERLQMAAAPQEQKLCRGTLFSHGQYRTDIVNWGYEDARRAPAGKMTQEQIDQWTAAFD